MVTDTELPLSPTAQAESEHSPHYTQEELTKARSGAKEFADTFAKSTLSQRKFLHHGEMHQELQSMFIGVKPLTTIPSEEAMGQLKDIPLPSRFHIIEHDFDRYLYDEEQVKQTFEQNPELFGDDFDKFSGDVRAYLDDLLHARNATGASSEADTERVGLLLGFPKDAVLEYAKYNNARELVKSFFRSQANHLLSSPDSGPLAREIYIQFSGIDSNGQSFNNLESLESFLDAKGEEVREFLVDFFHGNVKPEEIDYIVNARGVSTHGIVFGARKTLEAYQDFPKKVDQLYEASGMNDLISKTRLVNLTRRSQIPQKNPLSVTLVN